MFVKNSVPFNAKTESAVFVQSEVVFLDKMCAMNCPTLIFLLTSIFTIVRCEVLTQSFIIRLNEMARIMEDQNQIIQEASLKTIVEEQRKVIEDQNKTIQNLTTVIKDLTTVFENQEKNLTRTIENLTENIEEQKQILDRLDTSKIFCTSLKTVILTYLVSYVHERKRPYF